MEDIEPRRLKTGQKPKFFLVKQLQPNRHLFTLTIFTLTMLQELGKIPKNISVCFLTLTYIFWWY